MKVQCDVCDVEAASVFCCADEAALCDNCDRRVHRANKVAGKHRRFSLLHPSSSLSSSSSAQPPPLCDICQERRGFLFCKEDRAILCRDCDVPIHTSSDLTRKHSRFLLTGARLSSAPITSSSSPSEIEEHDVEKLQATKECNSYSNKAISQEEAGSCSNNSSSISNYLINMLPGWHVDEFMSGDAATGGLSDDAPFTSVSPYGFYDQGEMNQNGMSQEYPIWVNQEQNFHKMNTSYTTLERWVPQVQTEFGTNTAQTPSCFYW